MSKKSFKFVLYKRDGIIAFNSSFMLLLAEIGPISKEQSCERNIFITRSTGHTKIILILSTKVVTFYIQAFII